MSAAQWRKAMNFSGTSRNWSGGRPVAAAPTARPMGSATAGPGSAAPTVGTLWRLWRHVRWRHLVVLVAVLLLSLIHI